MPAQAFTNHAGNPGANQPTGYVAADGFVGAPVTAFNPNSPTFNPVTFPSGVHGYLASAQLAMTVTATANTDFTMSLPTGANVTSMSVLTTTAFGAVTDAQLQIGNAAAGAQYVAATSIKAAGVVTLAFAATAASASGLLSLPAAPNLFIRIVQSGGNSATGAATLVVNYAIV